MYDVIMFHAQPAMGDKFRRLVSRMQFGWPVPKTRSLGHAGRESGASLINLIPRLTDELKDFYYIA